MRRDALKDPFTLVKTITEGFLVVNSRTLTWTEISPDAAALLLKPEEARDADQEAFISEAASLGWIHDA